MRMGMRRFTRLAERGVPADEVIVRDRDPDGHFHLFHAQITN